MELLLVYRDPKLGAAWEGHFSGQGNVPMVRGDICRVRCDAVVSPLNSFGIIDDGLDRALAERFGDGVREVFQLLIRARKAGAFRVGQAEIVPTGDAAVPWLIVAPTAPGQEGVYLDGPQAAMKAALTSAKAHALEPRIETIAAPGMRAGTIPYSIVALQMWNAYCEVVLAKRNRGPCRCDQREKMPGLLEEKGVPRGYCGACDDCGKPGHVRHHPGGVPFTGAWCDEHYDSLVDQMRAEGRML
jgi:O-acetyl-ADP-ribose deacetylase (regulator of RNase III)